MPIVVNLDVMLARRKMRLNELADRVGITATIRHGSGSLEAEPDGNTGCVWHAGVSSGNA